MILSIIIMLAAFIVLRDEYYLGIRRIARIVSNYFWIPVLGWFFMSSKASVKFRVFLFYAASLVIPIAFGIKGLDTIGVFWIYFFLTAAIMHVVLIACIIIPHICGLKPILSINAASNPFFQTGYSRIGSMNDTEGLKVYTTDNVTSEEGLLLPSGTQLFKEKITESKYLITFKGVAAVSGTLVPVTIRYDKSRNSLTRMEIDPKNASNCYSIQAFRQFINDTLTKHKDAFTKKLNDLGIYPKKHSQDNFFKEDLTNKGGIVFKGTWLGISFSETKTSFYYFDSKKDRIEFKRICEDYLRAYNKEIYEKTSSLGKTFASYGL